MVKNLVTRSRYGKYLLRRRFDIPTGTKCAIFQLINFHTLMFGAPERLTAFGARTFLGFSHKK
jgi:hypothetical protein